MSDGYNVEIQGMESETSGGQLLRLVQQTLGRAARIAREMHAELDQGTELDMAASAQLAGALRSFDQCLDGVERALTVISMPGYTVHHAAQDQPLTGDEDPSISTLADPQ